MKIRQVRQFLYWITYTALVPVGLLFAVWCIAKLIQSPNGGSSAFAEIFGTGDLLPLAAILLLSSSADIRMVKDESIGLVLACSEVVFLISGLAAILMFGLFKMRGVELLKIASGDAASAALLVAFAKFSWAYIAAAITVTALVKFRLLAADP